MTMHTCTVIRRLALKTVTLMILAGGSTGCGKQLCELTGRVTFQGQPVTSGSVVLYCDGQIVRGLISPDGTYAITNVPRGRVRVTVTPPVRVPDGFRKKYALPPVVNGPIMPEIGRPVKDARARAVPARYSVPEESGLTVTVHRGVTEFDINLTQ